MFIITAASGVVAFGMAWAIGAQDVSNALGTSVGSKALTPNQAIMVGAIFEFLGSLLGGSVATTISKGVIHPKDLADNIDVYVRIMFATLFGAFIWLAIATYFSLPVSTSHSLVGSLLGLGLVYLDWKLVNFNTIKAILASWVASPLIGFIVAYSIFYIIYHYILTRPHPKHEALQKLPFFYGFTFGTLTLFLALKGPKIFRVELVPALVLALFTALLVTSALKYIVITGKLFWFENNTNKTDKKDKDINDKDMTKKKQKKIKTKQVEITPSTLQSSPTSKKRETSVAQTDNNIKNNKNSPQTPRKAAATPRKEKTKIIDLENPSEDNNQTDIPIDPKLQQAEQTFASLMVITACVVAFAHGSNDVSNSVGPFAAIIDVYMNGVDGVVVDRPVPTFILMAGGIGIVFGLATYGYKCMETVGQRITKLTFSRGYAAQISAAFTVLGATLIGLSVSTTHCLIGAITGVGLVESVETLNVPMLKKIALSWIVTVPASAFFSLMIYAMLLLYF